MESLFTFIISALTSNIITVSIMFHFSSRRYKRAYNSDNIYILSFFLMTILMCALNYFHVPLLNLAGSIMITVLCSTVLFYSEGKSWLVRLAETLSFAFVLMMCESFGTFAVKYAADLCRITDVAFDNIKMTVSGLVMLFLYYVCISRIWKGGEEVLWFKPNRYWVYIILILYNIVNVIFVIRNMPQMEIETEKNILLMNMALIVIVDIYILHFLQYIDEKEKLEIQLQLLEQQAEIQYHYYNNQEEQYRKMSRILHDVNKHIAMLEGLYQAEGQRNTAQYAREIRDILNPLMPKKYTNQILLNIILDEKRKQAELRGIAVQYEIENVSLNFMKPIEITTIFANLLENAIEACEKAEMEGSFINLTMKSYHEMILVALKNTSPENIWKKGKPVSSKKGHHGIGLVNVEGIVDKYNGNMELQEEKGVFFCRLFWNMGEEVKKE